MVWGDPAPGCGKTYYTEFTCYSGGPMKTATYPAEAYTGTITLNCCDLSNGWYMSGTNCLPCSYPCLNCTGSATSCTSCRTTTGRISASNCACTSGYYETGS